MPMKIRLGLPSRSSLVHCAAVACASKQGLLSLGDYDPAAVQITGSNSEVIFARNRSLPALLSSGAVDAIFGSSDYFDDSPASYTSGTERRTAPIIDAQVALLTRPETQWPPSRIYSSYNRLAADLARGWELPNPELVHVSGCCETYIFLDAGSASIDVVCTGRTAQRNGLVVRKTGPAVHWGWFFRKAAPARVTETLCMSDDVVSRLQCIYGELANDRDPSIANLVRRCA
jgi:ATP phosphoribosyltransferase